MPVSTARDALLHARVERFTRMLHGLEDGDVKSVHRTRVASRRLREVLPVLQLDPEISEKVGRRLRKVTQRLGPVRELDVLVALIDELAASGRYPTAALARVGTVVKTERDQARARFRAKRPVAELTRLAARLEKIARTLATEDATPKRQQPSARSWQWALDARAAHRAAALAAAMADAGAVYLPERLHAIRIAVKKLRYALEVSAEVARVRSTPDLRLLRRVQDTLGRLHDLHVLEDRVRQLQAALSPPDVNVWRQLDTLEVSLDEECRRLHGRYMRERDALAALCARLAGQRDRDIRNRKSGIRNST
jgi:CHAD domain-containing protein